MQPRILRILLLTAVSFLAMAHAQDRGSYLGASTGAVSLLGYVGLPVSAHVGFENVLFDQIDVRVGGTYYVGGGDGAEVHVDALYTLPSMGGPDVYLGVGPRAFLVESDGLAGLGLLAGATFPFTPSLTGFAEFQANTYFLGPLGVTVGGVRLGVNVPLD